MEPANYNPAEREKHWQSYWEGIGVYSFDVKGKKKANKKVFSIDTPPPTMSGRMHIGHAFSYSQEDFIARYKRMQGFNVFFPFGTDDNGLPTERMIEKLKNVKAADMSRQEFIELCLRTIDGLKGEFVGDWKKLGISCDFELMYSTINEHCRAISQWSFIDLYKKKRVYRKEAPTIWCVECRTAIAQAEMQDKEKETELVYVEAKTSAGKKITFATTRPELMMACVAISVHPKDKRYKSFVGKKARIPATEIEVPIIADEMTKMDFGTGAVYWCPFGDAADVEFVAKHPELKIKHIKNADGTLNEDAGKYNGMRLNQARRQVIEDWQNVKAVKKIEKIKHVVNAHERCGTPIEYLVSRQWFVKYLDLRKEFLKLGRKLKFYPDFMRLRYENWVKGLKWDWCVSRQRYFGVPFPVWYCSGCGEVKLADVGSLPVDPLADKPKGKCLKCGCGEFEPEKDVLDTWATSSLTPLIGAKLVEGKFDYEKLMPNDLRPQAHDIISTWLFYTIAKSYLHFKKLPWKNAAISGWVLDPYGKKMSKSKGNIIAPQEIMSKHSADALRFAAAGAKLGEDVAFQEKELVAGQKFVTKLWNASRFCFMHLSDYKGVKPRKLEIFDRWILSKLNRIVKKATESFEEYEYSKTRLEVEKFFWHDFCDNYLELVKDRLYNAGKRGAEARKSAQYALYNVLLAVVKLMAPITPHITEEVYQQYFASKEKKESVHLSSWPKFDIRMADSKAENAGELGIEILGKVRQFKAANKVSMKAEVNLILDKKEFIMLKDVIDDLKAVTNAKQIDIGEFKVELV